MHCAGDGVSLLEAIEGGIKAIMEWKPGPPCGSKENPHLISPRPARFPVCVTCGAGYADAALEADARSRGIDTTDWKGIGG